MFTHRDLQELRDTSLKMQGWIRKQTFSPQMEKTLRRFSSWEVSELILKVNQSTFRGRLAGDPSLPDGEVEEDGRQRWFSLEEINEMRRKMKVNRKPMTPHRPAGKRAIRVAVANFKGGAGKSTVALHFAHAAALDGYRVLCVDFDPQATLSHSMGLSDVNEEHTVWGIMARDLVRETERMNRAAQGAESGTALPRRKLPASITDMGLGELRATDFIKPTCWPTIDLVPSCANAAFVEFASAQYRHMNPDWSFFAAVSRWLSTRARTRFSRSGVSHDRPHPGPRAVLGLRDRRCRVGHAGRCAAVAHQRHASRSRSRASRTRSRAAGCVRRG